MERIDVLRGDIVLVDLQVGIGSEQGGIRPAVIIQNDVSNKYSPTTIVAPVTSKVFTKEYPTNVELGEDSGLSTKSTVFLNQIRTIDKSRIVKILGRLRDIDLRKVNSAIKVSLGLT